MRKLRNFSVVLFFFATVLLQAQVTPHMFGRSSQEYETILLLYAKTGIVEPSSVFPVSASEMRLFFNRIPFDKLDEKTKELYWNLKEKLDATQKKEIGLSAKIGINLEGYLQANPADFGGIGYSDSALKNYIDQKYPIQSSGEYAFGSTYGHRLTCDENLLYGFKERKPWLYVPLEFYFSPWVFAKFAIQGKNVRSFYAFHYPSINGMLSTNMLTEKDYFDMNFPEEAYISIDGPFFNIFAGRTPDGGWGSGRTGNLLFGNQLDFYDNLRFSLFSNIFKYTFQLTNFDSFFGFAEASAPEGGSGIPDASPEYMNYFVTHRFEVRLFNRITAAISESAMVWSKTFMLQTLSPLVFLHNSYAFEPINVGMSIELDAYIGAGFGVYFQWYSDQLTIQDEIDLRGSLVEPQAWAYMGGVYYRNSFSWGAYSSFLEFVLTDPYLYLEKGRPNQFAHYRNFDNAYKAAGYSGIRKIAKPVGYLYGPDAIVVSLGQEFSIKTFMIKPLLTYFLAGENNRALIYRTGIAANNQRTPTGSVYEHNLIAQVKVSHKINNFFEVYGHTGCIYSINHFNEAARNDFDFQLTLGASFEIGGTLRFKANY